MWSKRISLSELISPREDNIFSEAGNFCNMATKHTTSHNTNISEDMTSHHNYVAIINYKQNTY